MAERSHSVRLTRWDYIFRALTLVTLVLYAFVVYDNFVHSFTSISIYNLPGHYFTTFVVTPSMLLVSGLIVWRAPGNSVGRYLLLLWIGALGWQFSYEVGSPQLASFLATAFLIYWFGLAFPSLLYLMLSFPTGHIFPPGWTRWVVVFATVKFMGVVLEFMAIPSSDAFLGPLLEKYGRLFFFPSLVPLQPLITLTIGSNGVLVLIGLIAGIVSIVLRYRASAPGARQQIKWVAWSFGILALTIPAASAINLLPSFRRMAPEGAAAVFITGLLIVIVSMSISVLRYHLFDIDLIINRTLVYVPLTAIVAGVFAASITLSQKFFEALTGEKSDAAIVLTTLIVVSAFTPIKERLEKIVEKRFKEAPDPTQTLKAFGTEVRSFVQLTDPQQITRRMLDEAVRAFDAQGGAVYLGSGRDVQLVQASDNWNGEAKLTVPLKSKGRELGFLSLGARSNGGVHPG
jgi:hypothetical protein